MNKKIKHPSKRHRMLQSAVVACSAPTPRVQQVMAPPQWSVQSAVACTAADGCTLTRLWRPAYVPPLETLRS